MLKAMYKLLNKRVGDGEQQPQFRIANKLGHYEILTVMLEIRDKTEEVTS